ncbi:MAG: Methionine aminopeptidase [Candidatus Magasanikbacteria bacterium GW2011_GWC2_45_8]|uniref:Methionine aminopeptidase n=1 Tax=Candidatus Magasanikbacteria bacterium GW2011_GWC2_45_8 TaxID=1619050 RepID=A0A0G1MWL5_9BACT|nr:MAG: Methionine aminopeptidase [Candidatus Magasanikbacteria bacterium GW2011_GWC2_45_8]
MNTGITIKTPEEIELIREGGAHMHRILWHLGDMAKKPGTTTEDLEAEAQKLIKECGGRPSFIGYGTEHGAPPFPTALCTSVNDILVHAPALPARTLHEGDLIGIDIGMEWPAKELRAKEKRFVHLTRGFYTDTAISVGVGRITKEAERLLKVTKKALDIAIKKVKAGVTVGEVSSSIETYAKKQGVGIVRDLVGHGVGYEVHEDPRIPNYLDKRLATVVLKEGMVIAIEPMFTLGDYRVETMEDKWSIRSIDGSLTAHFEHTIAVTARGADVLT